MKEVKAETAEVCLDGVCFRYPTNWTATRAEDGEGAVVDLQSAGVSFAIVGVYSEREPEELAEQMVDALRAEHGNLEIEEDLEDETGVSMDGMFISLDMVSYCWLRCWRIGAKTCAVLMQSIQPEATLCEKLFHALVKSARPDASDPASKSP